MYQSEYRKLTFIIVRVCLLMLPMTMLSGINSSISRVGFARLQYEGGGDWYNDPEVLPNLTRYVNTSLNTNLPIDQVVVKASDTKLYDSPFVYLTGHGNIRFTDREIQNLRDWMLRGGFL